MSPRSPRIELAIFTGERLESIIASCHEAACMVFADSRMSSREALTNDAIAFDIRRSAALLLPLLLRSRYAIPMRILRGLMGGDWNSETHLLNIQVPSYHRLNIFGRMDLRIDRYVATVISWWIRGLEPCDFLLTPPSGGIYWEKLLIRHLSSCWKVHGLYANRDIMRESMAHYRWRLMSKAEGIVSAENHGHYLRMRDVVSQSCYLPLSGYGGTAISLAEFYDLTS